MSRQTKPQAEPTAGFAYLIAGPDGLFKIGRSVRPERRVLEIAPKRHGLSVLATIPSVDPESVERWLHESFAHRRVSGEWFLLTEEEVAIIRAIPKADAIADLPAAVLALRHVNEAGGFAWGGRGESVVIPAYKQFNCRPDDETWADIESVRELAAKLFPARFSDSELLRVAVASLKRELTDQVAAMQKPKGGKK